jgi:hypothetical protein
MFLGYHHHIFGADFLIFLVPQLDLRPSVDYMEKLQRDISPGMRGILIDWLVEVSIVSYIDLIIRAVAGICFKINAAYLLFQKIRKKNASVHRK